MFLDQELVLRSLLMFALIWSVRTVQPRKLIVVASATSLAAVVAAITGAYSRVSWLDDLAHAVVTPLLAAGALVATGAMAVAHNRHARMLLASGMGLAFAVAWEAYEWLLPQLLESSIVTSVSDTWTDIGLGAGTSAIAGLMLSGKSKAALDERRRDTVPDLTE